MFPYKKIIADIDVDMTKGKNRLFKKNKDSNDDRNNIQVRKPNIVKTPVDAVVVMLSNFFFFKKSLNQ
tara:strand:- start:89 stop:292 length:204 start_codon:yes stop_codon:yes gene_type:complete